MDFADDLLREIQARKETAVRRLPTQLGIALEQQIKSGKIPSPLPKGWTREGYKDKSKKTPTLGYLALYQRILDGTLPDAGDAAQQYRDALRLACGFLLERDITDLKFRTNSPPRATPTIARPPDTLLSEILRTRERDGILMTCTYTVVAHDFNLGTPLPSLIDTRTLPKNLSFLESLAHEYILALEKNGPGDHLVFAQFARLIAGGISNGMSVEMLIAPGLRSLHSAPPVVDNLTFRTMLERARLRLAILLSLNRQQYNGRQLLRFDSDPLLNTAAYLHLHYAEELLIGNPRELEKQIQSKAPDALKQAEEHFSAKLCMSQEKESNSGHIVDELLRALPVRFLIEESSYLPDPGRHAYLWLKLLDDKYSTERLFLLDTETTQLVKKAVSVISKRSIPL